MKEEIITPYMGGGVMVIIEPLLTKIPKGKTPVRGVGITPGKSTSRNSHLPFMKVIYDKVVFIDTEKLSSSYGKIQTIVGDIMIKQKKCRVAYSWGCLLVHFNVFNIEENKWEGWNLRKGTK